MVELLDDFPSYVAAYKAQGEVHQDEYERVVMTRVNEVANQFGAINFIVRLETGMENYSVAALIDYLKISFQHIHRWNRMAIVSDQKYVRLFYDALSPLVPGQVIGYELKDFEKAKAWVSEPFLKDENSWQWNWKKQIINGALATSAMTLFSYLASKMAKKNFNESSLLGLAIQRWKPQTKKVTSQIGGWQAHCTLGAIWGMLYRSVESKKHPLMSPVLFGIFSGTSAVLLWKKLFDLNPRLLPADRNQFYLQLFLAHQVFTISMSQLASEEKFPFQRGKKSERFDSQ